MTDDDNALGLLEGLSTTRAIQAIHAGADSRRCAGHHAVRGHVGAERVESSTVPFPGVTRRPPVPTGAPHDRRRGPTGMGEPKELTDRYDTGSGMVAASPKARLAATMTQFVEDFEPSRSSCRPASSVIGIPTPTEGASIYPACQNLLLAARAWDWRGAHRLARHGGARVATLLDIPEHVFMAATIASGSPRRAAWTGASPTLERIWSTRTGG